MQIRAIMAAAAVAGVCAAAALKQPLEFMVTPAGEGNPRNSEADIQLPAARRKSIQASSEGRRA